MLEALRTMVDVPPLVVSMLCLALTSALAHLLRVLVLRGTEKGTLARLMLQEAIAGAELCGCCFELVIIADNFGVSTYAVFLFLLTIWWSRQWEDATACPYTYLEDVIELKYSWGIGILKSVAGLAGGVIVFKYIQFIWGMEFVATHKGRAYEKCTADLQVPVIVGAAIECGATFLCRIASRVIGELEPRFGSVIDSFIGTSLVVAAFNTSGGYFNPLLATSLKFGCRGHTALQHIVVYWIGASLGSVGACLLFQLRVVRDFLVGQKTIKAE